MGDNSAEVLEIPPRDKTLTKGGLSRSVSDTLCTSDFTCYILVTLRDKFSYPLSFVHNEWGKGAVVLYPNVSFSTEPRKSPISLGFQEQVYNSAEFKK